EQRFDVGKPFMLHLVLRLTRDFLLQAKLNQPIADRFGARDLDSSARYRSKDRVLPRIAWSLGIGNIVRGDGETQLVRFERAERGIQGVSQSLHRYASAEKLRGAVAIDT